MGLMQKIKDRFNPPQEEEIPWYDKPTPNPEDEEPVWYIPDTKNVKILTFISFMLLLLNCIGIIMEGLKNPASLGYLLPSSFIFVHYCYLLHKRQYKRKEGEK